MGTRSRVALVAMAVLVAMLVVALPAMAGTVAKGSSQMTVGATYATELSNQHIDLAAVSPATMQTKFTAKDQMYYWFRVPMAKTSGGKTSNWNPSTGKGTFYHSGSIRFVEATGGTHEIFRAEGIRIIAASKTSYTMSVSYKTTAGPYARVDLADVDARAEDHAQRQVVQDRRRAVQADGCRRRRHLQRARRQPRQDQGHLRRRPPAGPQVGG